MGQGHRVKNNGTHWKVLSQGILMLNIKALALTVQKVISKVKVFKKWVKLQGQGHRVKNNGIHGKVLSQGILMWNIKALALTVQKLLARLKFKRGGRNDRITEWQNDRQDKNNMPPPHLWIRGHKKSTGKHAVQLMLPLSLRELKTA